MLGRSIAAPLFPADYSVGSHPERLSSNIIWSLKFRNAKCATYSAVHLPDIRLNDEEAMTWESCREAFSALDFSVDDIDKMLAKAFGHINSPYWGEERKREIPTQQSLASVLDFLSGIGLNDDDICKVLRKFPEVLGCSVEHELSPNVKILEKVWGIEGKSLKNLLLRNPKVLGYNVDCKGDCMAQCTRCWVRF